jgi:hypothetical protein
MFEKEGVVMSYLEAEEEAGHGPRIIAGDLTRYLPPSPANALAFRVHEWVDDQAERDTSRTARQFLPIVQSVPEELHRDPECGRSTHSDHCADQPRKRSVIGLVGPPSVG